MSYATETARLGRLAGSSSHGLRNAIAVVIVLAVLAAAVFVALSGSEGTVVETTQIVEGFWDSDARPFGDNQGPR